MREEKFSLKLAREILEGKVEHAKIYSVDDHEMQVQEVHLDHAIMKYKNLKQKGGDGPWEDLSFDVKVDDRGYFMGDKFRVVSVKKVVIYGAKH